MRLIDADALKAYIDMQEGRPFIGCTIGEAFKIMTDEQPTIHPERIRGRWIIEKDCEGKTRTCTCELCGYKTGRFQWENPNFCANCGAEMDGEVTT